MILLLLFVTCLGTVTNLMLVIVKEPRGEGAGGHTERGFRGFSWGFCFLLSVFFERLRVFSVSFFFFPSPAKISVYLAVGCVFLFF